MKNVQDRRATTFCVAEFIVWRCEEYARKVMRQKQKERALRRQRRERKEING
ncbi:MAG: hypothetical protein K2O85_02545 [Helicobacter sp.]|nr:hypothetical protein [Helicobacter sp.]